MEKKQKSFSPMEYSQLQSEGLAPEGIPRQCPKCGVWGHYEELKKKKRDVCITVNCKSCGWCFEITKGIKS